MAQKFVTKNTVIKNTTRRTPVVNYVSEKLTALGVLIVLFLIIYWVWPYSSTSGEFVRVYNEQLDNGDFEGAYQTIEDTRKSGADTSFLTEGEAVRTREMAEIMNQFPL